jgi:hypothetical protein
VEPPLGIIVGVVAGAVALTAVAAAAAFFSRRNGDGANSALRSNRKEPECTQTGDLETQDLTTILGATTDETATTVIDASMECDFISDSLLML